MTFVARALGALAVAVVFAADAVAEDPASLDEVVITADLRERALRDLPASATVLDAQTLGVAGVQHFEDVLGLVPNLNWSAGTSRPRFFQLRGIGELEQWQGAPNPSVGFLIDGIDFSGVGMPAMLADVERIEVLRGPQGTVYGANALAGLIAVTTRAPSREGELDAHVTLGSHGTRGATGILGGPIGSGETAWRLVLNDYRSDGFRRNAYLRRDDTNGYDESNARLKFVTRPLEGVRAEFTAMWADLDNGYDAFSIDNSRTTLSDKPGQDTQLVRALALRVDFDRAESFEVTSRTTFGTSRGVYSFDGDWGNDDSWGANGPYDFFQRFDRERRALSEDLRIVSRGAVDAGADFAWLAGAYALRTDEAVRQRDLFNGGLHSGYLTLSRGYKAGGFNIGAAVPADKRSFAAETLESLEIGYRGANADRSLEGDVSLFYMRRAHQQVPAGEQLEPGNPLSFVLYNDNAARGENFGLEASLRWRPLPAWLLDLRAALLEAHYLDYVFDDRNLDGREQAHAPQYQFDLGIEYRHPRGAFVRVDFAGLDDFYFDVSHDERAPSRVLTHLKAGYSGKHWRAEVWLRNLFDRYYSQRGFRFGNEPPDFTPTRYVQAGDPRHVGVTVAYTFR